MDEKAGGMNNYPDDIRDYDNDPRSPFYDDSEELALEKRTDEIETEILTDPGLFAEAFCESAEEMQTDFMTSVLAEDKVKIRMSARLIADCYAIKLAKQEFSE